MAYDVPPMRVALAPDSRLLLIADASPSQDGPPGWRPTLVVAVNWLEKLKKLVPVRQERRR
jgi:hypothetical protein